MPRDEPDLPRPPRELPKYIHEPLQKQSPTRLRLIADYAEQLANAKEHQHEQEQEREQEQEQEQDQDTQPRDTENTDLPESVPAKASITTKKINNNHYYYWQWRDGDQIKSKYKGPVNPDK